MAEDQDPASKTEEATPRKLEEARKKGDVAKTPDLASWLSLAAATGVILWTGGYFALGLAEQLVPFIASPHAMLGLLDSGGGTEIARMAIFAAAPVLAAVMGATILAGAGGNLMQSGFLWTSDKLKPDLSRVSPMKGWQRIFGPDGLVQFLKTLLKLIATGVIAWLTLQPHAAELAGLAAMRPASVLPFALEMAGSLMTAILAFLGVTAGLDWLWQRFRFAQKMRMSREELKEDFKQSEGDPHVKARQKQIRMERARRRMMAAVPEATVVIMNPTHYAVALKYEAGETPAPMCVAKGVDSLALKIRAVAEEAGVPVVEDAPLARALYATVDVDQTIPRAHFEAVAKVIGFVLSRGRRNR
ncbi:flagellar biosynthesis protein FlhB [Brevundimonas sp.]|uniref:flagellar biosynthesis protein FlhB n=1 Tax=Brevundimonas sp. TaxID=1871086 RepID=UPI0025D5054D|nr:flagellar biosynthesis protein FlhB [Brevundimonas sp.]